MIIFFLSEIHLDATESELVELMINDTVWIKDRFTRYKSLISKADQWNNE